MSSVKVVVRARPLNARERDLNSRIVIEFAANQVRIVNPAPRNEHERKPKYFTFDKCYWSVQPQDPAFMTQQAVYDDIGRDVLDNAFAGYNACIMAYGQTGAGKTFSMMGDTDEPGIVPRLCRDMFSRMIQNSVRDENLSYRVEVCYIEIYNETVRDLLGTNTTMTRRVREHPVLGPYVEDVARHVVTSYADIERLLAQGNQHRTTGATRMNEQSSRSHAIFTIAFTQTRFSGDVDTAFETVSKVNLVDLAGSERAKASLATGARLKEGANINKSLTTLGTVISALGEKGGAQNDAFIPYRDSILTWLLKDSLGGNSKTVILAAISPASHNFEETVSTLRYASSAKKIINHAVVNEDANLRLIRELRAEIALLKNALGSTGQHGAFDSASAAAALSSPAAIAAAAAATTTAASAPPTPLLKKIARSEALVAEMTTSWQDRLSRTEKVLVDRDLAVKEYGLALRVESEAPHFVSLNDNPLSTGVTLYTLSPGITHVRWGAMRVRSSSAAVTSGTPSSGDDVPAEDALFPSDMPQNPEGMNPAAVILLDGVGIDRDHCYIAAETDTVTLHPVSEMCFVNGNQVTEPTELHQGDTVELGESYLWRFNNPIEAAKLKKTGALRPTVRSLMSPRRDSSRSLSGNLPALAASSASVSGSSQPNSPGPQSSVLGLQSPASSIPEPSTPSKPAVSVQHASTSPMRDAASSSASSLTSAVGAEQAPQALPQIDFSPSEPGDFELEAERHRNPNYLPPMPFDEAGSLFPTISAELIRRARAESMLDLPKSTTTDRARADSVVDLQQHAESTEHLNLMSSSFGDDMNLLDESLDLIDDDDAFSKELEDEFEEEPSSTIEATNDSPVVRDGTSSAYTEGDTTLLGDDEVSLDDADEQHEQLEQAHADADADADADAEGQRSQSLSMTLDGELAPEVEGSVATSDSLLLSDDHMLIDVQQPSGAEDVVLPSGDVQDVAVSSLAAAAAAISRPEELQVSTETVDTNVPAQHHDLLDTSSLIELLHQVDESSVLSQHIVNTTVAVDESASAPAVASSELPADAVLPSATDSTVSQLGTSHQNTSAAPELDGEPVLAEEVDSLAASTLTTSEGHAPPTVEPSATAEHANDMSSSDVADLIQNKIDGLCSQLAAEQSDLPADEGEQLMHELVQLRFRLFEIQQAQAEGGSPTDDGLQSLPPPLTPAQPSFSRVSELQAVTQQLEDAKAQLAALDQALASPTDRRNSRVAETDRALLAEMLHKLELRQSKLKAERTLEHEQILQLTQNLEQRVGELRNRGAASSSAGVGATSAAALLERPRADSGSHAATAPASPAPASATATVSASSKDEQVVEAAAISVLERCSVYISIPQAVEKIEVGSDHKESRFHFYIVRIRVGDNVWDLQRRYSQFREFHLAIRSKFPSGVKIMFPPRKTIGHRNPDFVERRRIRLESYLRCAIAAFLTEPLSPIADNPSKQTMQAEIPFLRP